MDDGIADSWQEDAVDKVQRNWAAQVHGKVAVLRVRFHDGRSEERDVYAHQPAILQGECILILNPSPIIP